MRFLSLAIPTSFLFSQLELVARTLHIEFSQHAKNQQDDNSCFFIFIMVVAGSDVGDFFLQRGCSRLPLSSDEAVQYTRQFDCSGTVGT